MRHTNRLRARAAAAAVDDDDDDDERWRRFGHHQVSVSACINPDGEVNTSIMRCLLSKHWGRAQGDR